MGASAWMVLVGVAGVLLGVALGLAIAQRRTTSATAPTAPTADEAPSLPPGISDVLMVLRSNAIVLDSADAVVLASPTARALRLVRGQDLVHSELRDLARAVRSGGGIRESRLALARGPIGAGTLMVNARVAQLGSEHVLLLVEDHTQAQRVEDVRRDFVANVSHELKTPVGGISLLAEAVLDASDDPEAVSRFAKRIRVESSRLTQLVQEIVDLSRLQASDSLSDPALVRVAPVAKEAADRIATLVEAKEIALIVAADPSVVVYGDAHMLGTAIDNLLTNAVNYSAPRTRVALGVRQVNGIVEITVTDQGHGIPQAEQERIFERFYRVDPARSRATGGTGLGLAIVKHIASNHGGEVRVWSEPGQGSTFTLRIPAAAAESDVRGASVTAGREGAR